MKTQMHINRMTFWDGKLSAAKTARGFQSGALPWSVCGCVHVCSFQEEDKKQTGESIGLF